jgi:hypothetical protein
VKSSSKWLLGIGAAAAAVLTILFVRKGVQGAKVWQAATLAESGWEWDGMFREPQSDISGYPDGTVKIPFSQLPFSITAIKNSVPDMVNPKSVFRYSHPVSGTTYYIVGQVKAGPDKMIAIIPLGTGGLVG